MLLGVDVLDGRLGEPLRERRDLRDERVRVLDRLLEALLLVLLDVDARDAQVLLRLLELLLRVRGVPARVGQLELLVELGLAQRVEREAQRLVERRLVRRAQHRAVRRAQFCRHRRRHRVI